MTIKKFFRNYIWFFSKIWGRPLGWLILLGLLALMYFGGGGSLLFRVLFSVFIVLSLPVAVMYESVDYDLNKLSDEGGLSK